MDNVKQAIQIELMQDLIADLKGYQGEILVKNKCEDFFDLLIEQSKDVTRYWLYQEMVMEYQIKINKILINGGSSSKLVDNTESTIFGTWKLKI
jgi:hypothetical protein